MPTHIALGRSVGLNEEQLAAIADDDGDGVHDDALSDVERLVVTYSRRLTRSEPIDDDLYAALREQFTLHEVMELCLIIGISGIVNRFHATFHTPLDERTREAFEGSSPLPLPPTPDVAG